MIDKKFERETGKDRWTSRCQITDKIHVPHSFWIMRVLDHDQKLHDIWFFQLL